MPYFYVALHKVYIFLTGLVTSLIYTAPWTIPTRTITPQANCPPDNHPLDNCSLCQLPPGQLLPRQLSPEQLPSIPIASRTITPGQLTPVLVPLRSVAPFHSIAHHQTSQLSESSNSFSKGFIFIYNAYFRHCSRNYFSDTQTEVDNYPADNFFLDKCACLLPRELSSRELSLETNFL